ncbi:MAG: hypothetical protein IJC25_06960 [Clostridia bacterium]|nr:hypothetical protein [Clostridia bacterium]
MKYLFICTANVCRSPMAEAIARSMGMDAESAGFSAYVGESIDKEAAQVLEKHGIAVAQTEARRFTKPLGEQAETLCVMGEDALDFMRMRYPQFVEKTVVLPGIPDPMGKGAAAFEECFDALKKAVEGLPR